MVGSTFAEWMCQALRDYGDAGNVLPEIKQGTGKWHRDTIFHLSSKVWKSDNTVYQSGHKRLPFIAGIGVDH